MEEEWAYQQFEKLRAQKKLVTGPGLISMMLKQFSNMCGGSQKKLHGWLYRFKIRRGLGISRKTHTATTDKQDMGGKVFDFVDHFHKTISEFRTPRLF